MRSFIATILLIKTCFANAQFERITHPKYISSDSLLVMINNASIYPGMQKVFPYYISLNNNVNDSVKHGLLSLLKKNKLTEFEISVNVISEFKKHFEYICFDKVLDSSTFLAKEIYYKRFAQISQLRRHDTTNSVFSREFFKIFDSVYTSLYDTFSMSFKKNAEIKLRNIILKVPNEIILSNAVAQVKESVPVLKKLLGDINSNYDKNIIELALAILGDSIYQQRIFYQHKKYLTKNKSLESELDKDIHDLLLINTQQSIGLLADWLDTSRKFNTRLSSEGEESEFYSASKVVVALLKLVKDKNSQEDFLKIPANTIYPKCDFFFFEEVSVGQILFMKQWMLENKNKYDLN